MAIKSVIMSVEGGQQILYGKENCIRLIPKSLPKRTYRVEAEETEDGKMRFICYYGRYIEAIKACADFSMPIEPPYQPGDILRICSMAFAFPYGELWVQVTDIRLERLWDSAEHKAKERLAETWDVTIDASKLESYGWNANPWVLVVRFERCEKPEEA